jgi:ERCC4-type nuclease
VGLSAVLIDSREPPWVRQLSFGGAPVVTAPLEAGDLHAACDDGELLAVERKTPRDFLRALGDGRLFPELDALRRQSRWCYLVVTGELQPGANGRCWDAGRETGWRWNAVQGALLTCQEIGVGVAWCLGDLGYEPTVMHLADRTRATLRVPPPRETAVMDEREALLASLPGVGAVRARALLDYCGTPAWVLHFLTEGDAGLTELERDETAAPTAVPGVGPGTKDRVRRLLGLPDDQVLAVIGRELYAPTEAAATGTPADEVGAHATEQESAGR